jgi:hypothetical protein
MLCVIPLLGDGARAREGAQQPSVHAVEIWRQPQGLPQDTVLSLLQTRDSYLWIGTKGGLARFDGVRFTTFDDSNTEQLKENEIWALGRQRFQPVDRHVRRRAEAIEGREVHELHNR